MKALFDTNILIDHLKGIEAARTELRLHDDPAISVITWIEVMVGASAANEAATRSFLNRFRLILIDSEIAEAAVRLRRNRRIRLPDALIWATARVGSRLLVTRNTADFPPDDPGIREPYRV